MHSAMDLDGLVDVLASIEAGEIQVHFATTRPMTPMAAELLPEWYRAASDAPPSGSISRRPTRRLPSDSARDLLHRPRRLELE